MLHRRSRLTLACMLMAAWIALPFAASAADPPKINRPRPAPPVLPTDVVPLPPAMIDDGLEIGGDELKARKVETRLGIDVHVNGRGPYRFIVDSGADTSAVGLRLARDLQLPLGTPAILNSMTSRDVVDRVMVDALALGPSTIRDLHLPALREIDLGGDGLIGIDALVEQRLLMDFDKKLIRVEDARIPERYEPGTIVVTARRKRGQLILTQVRAGGLSLEAVIDTGSQVTIGNSALRNQLIRSKRGKFWTAEAIGVTGVTIALEFAIIPELRIGPVTLLNVPMAFADVPPFALFDLSDEPALLLGTDLLENFRRISLDFRARKVRFQLRRCEQNVFISTAASSFHTRLRGSGSAVCT